MSTPLAGERVTLACGTFFDFCWNNYSVILINHVLTGALFVCLFCLLFCVPCVIFLSQAWSKLRALRVGMGKSKNKMAKIGRVFTQRSRPFLKRRGPACSKRDVRTFDTLPKSHKHVQGIIYNGKLRGHTTVFDTGDQQPMIGRDGWEIIKRLDTWIYAQGVN